MATVWTAAALIVTTGSVAGLAAVLVRMWLGSRANGEVPEGDARRGFSFDRYQVMERLLSSRDVQYLSSQRGFPPAAAARWKRESLHIFRLYLGELTRDFDALHASARRMVAASHSESPELAATLVRQQVAFFRARVAVEWRILLFRFGMASVDVAPLLAMVDAMRIDLRRIVPDAAQPF